VCTANAHARGAAGCSKKGNKEEIDALLKSKKEAAEAREVAEQQKKDVAKERAEKKGTPAVNLIEVGELKCSGTLIYFSLVMT
jgi:hypothetical protein